MEFTRGSIRVQFVVQRFLKPPILIHALKNNANDEELDSTGLHTFKVSHNPHHYPTVKSSFLERLTFPKFMWLYIRYNFNIITCFCFGRIIWLLSNWNRLKDFEQLGYLTLFTAICCIADTSHGAVDKHVDETCYLLTQTFKVLHEHSRQTTSLSSKDWRVIPREKPEHKELFIYSMTVGFFAFPLFLSTIPLFREYDPMQLCIINLWKLLFSSTPSLLILAVIKVLCSLNYVFLGNQGAACVFTVMLFICIVMVEACVHLSKELFPCRRKKRNTLEKLEFENCLKTFRLLQILIQIEYWIVHKFLSVLVGMGVLATAWGGYVMLVMYDQFPFILYLACSVIFFFCMAVNFLLVTLAGIPNQNGKLFSQYWKMRLRSRLDKLVLKSCPEIGFTLGCVKPVKFHTALRIMDTMINCSVTLALMKLNGGQSWR